MQVLGTESFLTIPDVNGSPVLINGGGTGLISTGLFSARPIASTSGNIYVDTTNNYIWRDTGTSWVQLTPGTVMQVAVGIIPATSGTTTVPNDNTMPTSTEGIQIFTTNFTPILATSRIVVHYSITVNTNTSNTNIATCLFAGTINQGAAVIRCATSTGTTGVGYSLSNTVSWLPGSTATITIQGRCGPMAASTCYINNHATPFFGGALASDYTIMEII